MEINNKELENATALIVSNLAVLGEQDVDRILQNIKDTVKSIREEMLKNVKVVEE